MLQRDYTTSQLDVLEAEAIHIMREVAAEFERPVLLFSGGKDSIVMLRLAEKAFWPAPIPFPLMHVDTGHNFPEVLEFRDRRSRGARRPPDRGQRAGRDRRRRVVEETGRTASRNRLQTTDAAGRDRGAPVRRGLRRRPPRRGEGPRQGAGVLLPRRVRPVGPEEPAPRAVEPLQRAGSATASTSGCSRCPTGPSSTSGSTSRARASRCRPSTTRTRARCSSATACCCADNEFVSREARRAAVRERGALPHGRRRDLHRRGRSRPPATVEEIIEEVAATRITERGATRADDRASEAAMEDRKREGYF